MNWIKVKKELPKFDVPVIGYWSPTIIEGAVYTTLDGEPYWYLLQDGEYSNTPPTHWAEIETPKE